MQDYTVLAVEPNTKTLIEIICSNEKDMDEYAREAKESGCKGVMAVQVMR